MKHLTITSILLLLFACTVFAQTSRFGFSKFINNGDTLNYRLLYPDYDTVRKYPLIIFLHGSGERGNDNEAQLKWGVMNFATDQMMFAHPAVIIVPQCPEGGDDWSNFSEKKDSRSLQLMPSPSKPMELLIELIHQAIKTMPVDADRIYITGLSSGGYGTYDAIERYPNLFAAAVPVCGAGDTSKAASIAHIPIWIFQGGEDAGVNPLSAKDMLDALLKAGGHPGFTLYPEVGHFSWLGAYTDPLMFDWLFRQHK